MGARGALYFLIVAAPACATSGGDSAAEGFVVVGTTPDPGADDALETTDPELRVSASADPVTCTEESLIFAGISEDGAVAFVPPYSITLEDDGSRIRFMREDTLPRGYRYAVVVQSGGSATCTDVDGRALEAYGFEFYVP